MLPGWELDSFQPLFQEFLPMASASSSKKRRSTRAHLIFKPRGVIHPRVQAVGPEHFGIVCVDCAKARSKWMLADFYGKVLVPPTPVEHTRHGLEAMVQTVLQVIKRSGLRDVIVGIERTGRYHLPVKRAFVQAGFDTRSVHPLTSKQFRQPANPGNKTDDTDLNAIFRAMVNGFGLIEQPADPVSVRLQLLARHRRDWVEKMVALRCQIHEHLQAIMPGYAKCFDDIYDSNIPLLIAKDFGSAASILQAGLSGLTQHVRQAGVRPHRPTFDKILAWARTSADPTAEALIHHRIMRELDDDRVVKLRAVKGVEGELAEFLVQTPYMLLMSIPGINVVSAAAFAGEMGPIQFYPHARAITGRAGLFPSRYQSDEVDRPDGKLVRCANHRLRSAIMIIADNLIECNDHFRILATQWKLEGKDPRAIRVRVAGRFCRIAYQMVAGRTAYRHPSCQQRDYVLCKLITFFIEHDIDIIRIMKHLDAAVAQLPGAEHREEGAALATELDRLQKKRGSGPRSLAEILPAVLAKLGVQLVTSTKSGEADLT
jgi:transposase